MDFLLLRAQLLYLMPAGFCFPARKRVLKKGTEHLWIWAALPQVLNKALELKIITFFLALPSLFSVFIAVTKQQMS